MNLNRKQWMVLICFFICCSGVTGILRSQDSNFDTSSFNIDDNAGYVPLQADKVVILSSEVVAVIKKIHHKAQDFVKKGDVLIDFDAELIELQVERIEEQLQMGTKFKKALVNQEYRTDTYNLLKGLAEEKIGNTNIAAVSQKELREAKQAKEIADLDVQEAKLEKILMENDLKTQKVNLKKHKVVSPIDGVVVSFNTIPSMRERSLKKPEVGEAVRTGQEVMVVMKVDRFKLSHQVPASQVNSVKLGQEAIVYVRDYEDTPVLAKVVYISPTVVINEFEIQVELKNPPKKDAAKGEYPYLFREGMEARVELDNIPDN